MYIGRSILLPIPNKLPTYLSGVDVSFVVNSSVGTLLFKHDNGGVVGRGNGRSNAVPSCAAALASRSDWLEISDRSQGHDHRGNTGCGAAISTAKW